MYVGPSYKAKDTESCEPIHYWIFSFKRIISSLLSMILRFYLKRKDDDTIGIRILQYIYNTIEKREIGF